MNFRNLSAWSIRNPVIPLVAFAALFFAGMIAFSRMEVVNNPDVEFPGVQVSISQPGAAPSEIENQITQQVESAVRSLTGVRNISSTAREGNSGTFIEFEIGTDPNVAVADVKNAIDRVRGSLPDGILEPTVSRVDISGGFLGIFAVQADDMTIEQLSWFIDDTVAKQLLAIEGMGEINRFGGVDREIEVLLDPARMQALGVTAGQINAVLRQSNIDAGGGMAEVGGTRQSVRVLGNTKSAFELSQAQIQLGGGRTIKLADVADVRDGYSEKTSLAKVRNKEVVNFSMARAKGASDVTVFDAAQEAIKKIEAENPGVTFIQLFDTVKYTKNQYDSSIAAMVEGAILAVVVVFFFLRDWRATIISAIAIPLSAIPTFWFMDLLGFNLNFLSLLALGLVAGVLVDDAIVEIENIVRHMRMGKSAYQASIDAADEIGLAVVSTSFCIVAVFLPVGVMPGVTGQFFKNFGLTVVVAVLMSLAVARMITPMMAAYFLQSKGHASHGEGKWMDRYMRVLRWSLERGKMQARRAGLTGPKRRFLYVLTFILVILLLIILPGSVIFELWSGAFSGSGGVSGLKIEEAIVTAIGLSPADGIGFVLNRIILLILLAGVTAGGFLAGVLVLRFFRLVTGMLGRQLSGSWRWLEARFYDHRVWMLATGYFAFMLTVLLFSNAPFQFDPEIDDDTSRVEIEMVPGTTLASTERVSDEVVAFLEKQPEVFRALQVVREGTSTIWITLAEDRPRKSYQFERDIGPQLTQFADARVRFQSDGGPGGGGSGRDLTIMLAGSDPALLNQTAAKLVEEMKGLKSIVSPRIAADLSRPELIIRPRPDIAAELGVTTLGLSQAIRIATMGEIEQNAAKFSLSDRQIPITVKLPAASRRDLATIKNLPVPIASGGSVPLSRVADVEFGAGPTTIQRYNQNRRVFIGADLAANVLRGDAMAQVDKLPTLTKLPQGVIRDAVGSDELQNELQENFGTALLSGILLVFAVLVLLYKRLMSPLVNMTSLALAPLGGIFLIWLVGQPNSMPVLIGTLLLLGIVSKNSILLIDFAIEEMESGTEKLAAIMEAGHKRAQPIVMTTVAMTAGMVPTAISLTGDGAWRQPMGVVVIGGLILSTLLTLMIVPAGFSLADGMEKRMGPWMRKKFLTFKPGDETSSNVGNVGGPAPAPAGSAAVIPAAQNPLPGGYPAE